MCNIDCQNIQVSGYKMTERLHILGHKIWSTWVSYQATWNITIANAVTR